MHPQSNTRDLHMCISEGAAPVRGKILLPRFKAIAKFAKEHAEREQTWCMGHDTQRDMDVGNVGKDFGKVVEKVFGKGGIRKVLFPAVYAGRVAKEISGAGFEVVCTDIQGMWVENARKLGMEAHLRSAEEFPEGKFDLVASFEPYPLYDNPLTFMLALRTMVETEGAILAFSLPSALPRLSARVRTVSDSGPERILLAYGNVCRCWEHDLAYSAMMVTAAARELARTDLEVISALEGAERASVAGLVERLGEEMRNAEDSLLRITGIIQKVCGYGLLLQFIGCGDGFEIDRLVWATGIRSLHDAKELPTGISYRDFVQEIEITD